jgi:hypothetical protein
LTPLKLGYSRELSAFRLRLMPEVETERSRSPHQRVDSFLEISENNRLIADKEHQTFV